MKQKEREKEREVIGKLAALINLTWYLGKIGTRTGYGERRGPEPWYYTKRLLRREYSEAEMQQVIEIFQAAGVEDEVAAAEWLVAHADDLPMQD